MSRAAFMAAPGRSPAALGFDLSTTSAPLWNQVGEGDCE